jgi:phosphotransferase system  glucose/maltose/N-acetylglucosamine-specific IIC component
MDATNFWTWFIVEAFGAAYVVGVLYYFFIRKFQKEKKENEEKAKKDSGIS